jgi:hypothetical protein
VSDASVRASRDTLVRGGFGTLVIVIMYLIKIFTWGGKSTDISSCHTGSSQASSGRLRAGSLTSAARQTDLNPPSGHLGVLLFPHEVDLGGADVAVTSEFSHLVQNTVTPHLK